jgi:hypothetical protein
MKEMCLKMRPERMKEMCLKMRPERMKVIPEIRLPMSLGHKPKGWIHNDNKRTEGTV